MPNAPLIVFLLAGLFNIAPALVLRPAREELVFVGGAHVLFALRLIVARSAAAKQRAIDLARFQEIYRSNRDTSGKSFA